MSEQRPYSVRHLPVRDSGISPTELATMFSRRAVVKNAFAEQHGGDVMVAIRRGDECVLVGIDAVVARQSLDISNFCEYNLIMEGGVSYGTVVAVVHNTVVADLLNAIAALGYATAMITDANVRIAVPIPPKPV